MIVAFAAALAGALTMFVGVGALTGQMGATRRQVLQRALRLELRRLRKEAVEQGDGRRAALLRADKVAGNPTLSAFLRRFRWTSRRATVLEQGNVPLKVSEYVFILAATFAGLAAMGSALTGFVPAGLALAVGAVAASEWGVHHRARARLERFNQQLPDALQMMAASLQSGFGIMEAIQTVSREMEPPLAEEFRRILDETRAGGAFETSLERMAERLDSLDLRLLTQALAVHRTAGGNLGEILAQVGTTMREREELRRHMKSLTAQERISSIIIALLPLFVAGLFLVMAPSFISPLWEETIGRGMLGAAVMLEAAGFLLMRQVMQIEV